MNRTLIMVGLALLLGGGVWWYTQYSQQQTATTLAGADRSFAVKDTARIGKIFLADRLGNQTTLERDGNRWRYNGKYWARPNAMKNLLQAIHGVEMKFKPANAAIPTMVKSLASEGIKVEIYDRSGQLMKLYYVGGAPPDERGTYMLLDGFEQPYVTSLPAWEGNLRFRYNLTGDDWRDRAVFSTPLEEISSVSIEYPQQRNKSFVLSKSGSGTYEVKPFYALTPTINRPLSTGKVEQFLVQFSNLQSVGFLNDFSGRDSLNQMIPFSIITLADSRGDTTAVKLVPQYTDPRVDPETGKITYADYVLGYYAFLHTGDLVTVSSEVFNKILWGYEFFYE